MGKTEDNLRTAFAGESQARNKYTFFAEVAKKEGFNYIARIFEETAENEKRHAKDELKLLGGIGDTLNNLKEAAAGEHYETTEMYPDFARTAKAEGNDKAEVLFRRIAEVEEHHRARFERLIKMVEDKTVFKRDEPIKWKCDVCGHVHEGTEPPEKCPCCKHPRSHFEPVNMDI